MGDDQAKCDTNAIKATIVEKTLPIANIDQSLCNDKFELNDAREITTIKIGGRTVKTPIAVFKRSILFPIVGVWLKNACMGLN